MDKEARAGEAEQRLQKVLQGAFAGAPTPLKEIPKPNGQARAQRVNSAKPDLKKEDGRARYK
jgi:hypothetical protein